jgi:hypothetical protein
MDNLLSGFLGAILGALASIVGGYVAARYTVQRQIEEQERAEHARIRRLFEGNLKIARRIATAHDLFWGIDSLRALRDLMKEHAWLCDPEPNRELFESYLMRLQDSERVPPYTDQYVSQIVEAVRKVVMNWD